MHYAAIFSGVITAVLLVAGVDLGLAFLMRAPREATTERD